MPGYSILKWNATDYMILSLTNSEYLVLRFIAHVIDYQWPFADKQCKLLSKGRIWFRTLTHAAYKKLGLHK